MDNLINLFKDIVKFVIDALLWFFDILRKIVEAAWEWFLNIPVSEKAIVLNGVVVVLAAAFYATRYWMFEYWNYVSNPLSVYLIGIYALMIASSFYRTNITFIARIVINCYYIAWVLYYHLGDKLTLVNIPHSVSPFFYLNYLAPVIFILAAVVSRLVYFR